MRQGKKIVGGASRRSIFIRSRGSVIALTALTIGLVSATSHTQVQAHDDAFSSQRGKFPDTAELFLPELKPGTYRLVIRKGENSGLRSSFTPLSDFEPKPRPTWRDRSPSLRWRVPNEPAPRRVAKPAFKFRTPAVQVFAVPKNFALIDAPRRVVAHKRFEAGWSGPNVSGDRLELVASGQRACSTSVLGISVHEYDANQDGEFTFLAPMRPGNYEIVYCSANQQRVLARHPVQVVAKSTFGPEVQTVRRLRPATKPQFASRPSFKLNSAVRDEAAEPRIRMFAPIASARTSELGDDVNKEPVFTVRPRRFDGRDDQNRVVTPVGRFRFEADRDDEKRPRFTVRPKTQFNSFSDDDEVVDISPRKRPVFEDDRRDDVAKKRMPRIRIFVDEENRDDLGSESKPIRAAAPKFGDDDAFARKVTVKKKKLREVKRPRIFKFDDDAPGSRQAARRPVFEADDMVRPRRRLAKKPKAEPKSTRRARSSFDEEDAFSVLVRKTPEVREAKKKPVRKPLFDDPRATDRSDFTDKSNDGFDLPRDDAVDLAARNDRNAGKILLDDAPVDRVDDFKSDEVGVAAAIARNKARYGDGLEETDDFFTIRGRYNWYKPVQADKSPRAKDQRRATREDRGDTDDQDNGRLIELKGADKFEEDDGRSRRSIIAAAKPTPLPQQRDLDEFGSENLDDTFGPPARDPVRDDERLFASRNTDLDRDLGESDFDPGSRSGKAPTGPIEMVRRTRDNQVAPQFDRIQPVKAGYRFAAGWTGDIRRKGWIAVARREARIDDYLSLQSAETKGELKFRAPSEPGRYELRFLSRDRRVVLARQSFEVEAAPVRLVALEYVDPSDNLNVWWAGPGDGSDSLTLARVGTRDSRYLTRQSVGKGNPLTMKAPAQPGTYEMRYVNGTDNRVLFRRKLVVAESQPTLLGP